MTLFGKILLLFNLAFSLLLAGWALNWFVNDIDEVDAKDKSATTRYVAREAELKELWDGASKSQANWLTERRKLLEEESRLAADRLWYDEETRHVLVTATADKPIGAILIAAKDDDNARIKKGQVLLDDKGYPLLPPAQGATTLKDRTGKPLQSLAEYRKQHEKILKEISDLLRQHEDQIKEAVKLTDLIIGDKMKGIRGFQQRIVDEQTKIAALLGEQKLIHPQEVNAKVELELIAKRHAQLKKRIEELEKINVASK